MTPNTDPFIPPWRIKAFLIRILRILACITLPMATDLQFAAVVLKPPTPAPNPFLVELVTSILLIVPILIIVFCNPFKPSFAPKTFNRSPDDISPTNKWKRYLPKNLRLICLLIIIGLIPGLLALIID
jgi:hypothetical protein